MSDVEVRDNPERHRFELLVDGAIGGLATYRMRADVVVVNHSEVDPTLRGRGMGGELARRTLDQLRERGVKVVPACPFFADYIARHPEYDDLVADVDTI